VRGIKVACAELVTQLKAAGFPGSSVDPETLNPPAAVWVQPRSVHDLTLGDSGSLLVWLYIIVPNVETEHALALLDDGLEGVLELLDEQGIPLADDAAPIDCTAAVLLPGQATPMPAYRLAIDLDL
jgi:hypothetical protein